MATSWLDVPRDIWLLIFEKLGNNLLGTIRFSAICSEFRSIASSGRQNNMMYRSPPLLLLPREAPDSVTTHDVFSVVHRRRSTYQVHLPQLQNKNRYCYGSSYGWLFTLDMNSGDCSLLNPITTKHISLPPVPLFALHSNPMYAMHCSHSHETAIPYWYIKKAIVTADPSEGKSWVVVLKFVSIRCKMVLSYYRPGDIDWTPITNYDKGFRDVIWHMGKLYAVTRDNKLVSWNHCDINSAARTIVNPTTEAKLKIFSKYLGFTHLVNSTDGTQLLMVCEYPSQGFTVFSVFKVDMEKKEFIELQSLGDDQALFLSAHSAFCVSTLGSTDVFANCIYSAYSPCFGGGEDHVAYVYNLDKKTCKTIYKRKCMRNALCICIWVTPSVKNMVRNLGRDLGGTTRTRRGARRDLGSGRVTYNLAGTTRDLGGTTGISSARTRARCHVLDRGEIVGTIVMHKKQKGRRLEWILSFWKSLNLDWTVDCWISKKK